MNATVNQVGGDFPSADGSDLECKWSDAVQQAANLCLQSHPGAFYDPCKNICHNSTSFLSLSNDANLEHLIYGKVFPVLVLLVVVANVLVAIVLSQKHMITPTNVVLYYMAVADLCVGIIPLPWNFFYHTLRNNEEENQIQLWWCYMYKYSMDAVPPICHNIAMWLTVLLAGQRYISIEYPIKSRQICSVRNVRISTVVITVASVICGSPKCVDFYLGVFEGWVYLPPGEWIYTRTCVTTLTPLVQAIGQNVYFNVYFWTRVLGFIILPSILLIVLNFLLIRGIQKAQMRKKTLLKQCRVLSWPICSSRQLLEKRAREAQRQIDSNSTSLMLVMVVSIFLVVNLPQAIFMGVICVQITFGIENSLLQGIFPIAFLLASNMLVMLTYPINFGIYCFMSSSFRKTFRAILCRWHDKRHHFDVTTTNGNTTTTINNNNTSTTLVLTSLRSNQDETGQITDRSRKSDVIEDSDQPGTTIDTVFL